MINLDKKREEILTKWDEKISQNINYVVSDIDDPRVGNLARDIMRGFISQALKEYGDAVVEECIKEINEYEIRDDSGGVYQTEDTILMQEELIQQLLNVKDQLSTERPK